MKLRFGLIGCGRVSQKHIEAIVKNCDSAELVALCDTKVEKAQEKAKEYSRLISAGSAPIAVYANIDQMLQREHLDVLTICTPSGLHSAHGVKAAKKGVNVVSEKPMAVSLGQADRLIQACDHSGVKLFVVKQNRLNPTMQLLKKSIEKGRFGNIYMILSNVLWSRPQEYYDESDWRGTAKFDGGALMNQASHYIDAMSWLGGPVESVSGCTSTLARNIEMEDVGSAIIKFKSGAIGSINFTTLTYPNNLEGSITVLGENGTVKIGGIALNKIEKWQFNKYNDDDLLVDQANYEPKNVYGHGHLAYYKNVIGVLKNNEKIETDGREGRLSVEIICSIYSSSIKRKTVSIPEHKT